MSKTTNMFYKYCLISLTLLSFVIACSSSKKTQVTNSTTPKPEEVTINLDTLTVLPKAEEPAKPYHATNTKLNDIIHTKLWVSFDWQKSQLHGKAEILIKPYFYPTSMLYLNARGMEIKSVKLYDASKITSKTGEKDKPYERADYLQEKPNTYQYENDSLKINLGRQYMSNENYYVTIEYIAKPNELKDGGSSAITENKGLYFVNPSGTDPNKIPQIWTQGETQSNSAWFPTIDNPTEKMTNEIYMTVDDKYTTLSNGLMVDSKKNADGTRTDHWKMDLPHAPYLVMMAVGEFKKVVDEPWNGKEISYYVEKKYEPHAKAMFGKTKKMIEFFSNRLGVPYPWQKYAQISVKDYVSGSMENTSATLHGDFMCDQTTREAIDGVKGEDVIAHELFHQWFGDLVTCESWSNLTLNESFATYGEYLWAEFEHGRDAADAHHAGSRFGYYATAKTKHVDLVRFDYNDREDMFDAISYAKGGQILHMLRKYIGDDAFFASLKLYLEKNKFKTAEAHDLRLAFEEVTGQDLNWFFNQWYFDKGHPELTVTKSYDATTKKLKIDIDQTQDLKNNALFKLPVYIDIYANDKKDRKLIWITGSKNSYSFTVESNPQLVNVDAERQLLAEITYQKNKDEYIYQYKNAPLWGDRIEALDYFKSNKNDKDIDAILKYIAQNDPWYKFRILALELLSETAPNREAEFKPMLIEIATKDKKNQVKAEAIKILSLSYNDNSLNSIYENGLKEQSYSIAAEALAATAKHIPDLALKKAKEFENEPSKHILYTIAELYTNNSPDEHHEFFKNMRNEFTGFEIISFNGIYGKYLSQCVKPETVIDGANQLANMAKTGDRYAKYTAQKALWNYLVKTWETKETSLTYKIEKAKKENQDVTNLNSEIKIVSDTKKQLMDIYSTIKI